MTDRHMGYIITLEKDIREDDAETLVKMLYQIRGIISVEPIKAQPLDVHVARMRNRHEFWKATKKFFEAGTDE